MMKSHSDVLVHTVAGLLKDVQLAYPTMNGLSKDYDRLTRLVVERGIGIFTLDLPARDQQLLAGLETGRLPPNGYQRYSKGYPVPRLFAGLYMRIFNKDLSLKVDADVNAIMFLRQLLCLGKKLELPCSERRKQLAIKEYVNVEQQLVNPTLEWGNDALDCATGGLLNRIHLCDSLGPDLPLYPEYNIGRSTREQLLLARCQHFADVIARELGIFCPDCYIEGRTAEGQGPGFKHGPGAVAEHGGSFDKYRFRHWSDKLQHFYPWETTGKLPSDERCRPINHEVPSRLICVPKTAKGPRIIAAEPSEHMYTQNLLASWLVSRIRATQIGKFINFKRQELSGEMVLKASLDRELATIDLSSASDRLSLFVVERMFRSNPSVLKAIHATRTRWLRLPSGECIELKKFASQGTALTFPVQTLVFWIISMAASHEGFLEMKDLGRYVNRVRTFGDDIIVPASRYAETTALLTALQLKVNTDKSFVNGHFRESCGVDAFKGYDITPSKPKTVVSGSPASCGAVIDTINNLFYKGYWHASDYLRNRQPPGSFKGIRVVGRDAGPTGFGSFSTSCYFGRSIAVSVWGNSGHNGELRSRGCSGDSLGRILVPRALAAIGLTTPRRDVRFNRSLQRLEVRIGCITTDTRSRHEQSWVRWFGSQEEFSFLVNILMLLGISLTGEEE